MLTTTSESESESGSDIVFLGDSSRPDSKRSTPYREESVEVLGDVVDLTIDEDEEEAEGNEKTERPQKKPRRNTELGLRAGRAEEHKARMRLVGEPFAEREGRFPSYRLKMELEGRERRWRGVTIGDRTIEVDTMVTCRGDNNEPDVRGLVRYVSERAFPGYKSEITCHVHWLIAAIGGERSELFLKHGACHDVELAQIQQVEHVRVGFVDAQLLQTSIRHVFEGGYNAWRDIKRLDRNHQPACDACLSHSHRTKRSIARRWHVDDCVLLDEGSVTTATAGTPWRVARIIDIDTEGSRCRVQLSDRSGRRPGEAGYVSSRRLVLSPATAVVSLIDILDQAYVAESEEATKSLPPDRAFFCDSRLDVNGHVVPLKHPLALCGKCTPPAIKKERLYRQFCQSVKLPAIDYYSGGGGGIIGASDHFEHKHAVEREKHACETLRHNFPGMNVIRCEVGAASQAAREGRAFRQVIDGVDRRVPGLPRPGSMALALAGPPCQGHTGANHHNQREDSRNDELFVTIGEIDRLRPDIFILENVPGMKQDKAEVNQEETRNFAAAAIKAIRRIGYQCRLVLLDSRSFGSPQNRVRLFIICARAGVPLPSIPEPTHANPSLSVNLFINSDADKPSRAFYVGSKGVQGTAPYPAVTVRDALSDLPPFEYDLGLGLPNPRRIPRFASRGPSGQRVGFVEAVEYAKPPRNDYQIRQRRGAAQILDHYTPTRSERQLDIIKQATLMVGQASDGTELETHGKYRRINPDRGATTVLTDSAPGGMYTGAIHWDQRRTLTVAERKRLQGVPDSYVLKGTVQEQDRMLGNMINVDMSRALHGHIHRTVFFPAWLEMGKPTDFFERWRERHPI